MTPRTFSHVGLSVPDLDAAVKFYSEVLGFYTIMKPTEVVEDDSDIGQMCTDVFGRAGSGCTSRIWRLPTAPTPDGDPRRARRPLRQASCPVGE